MMYIFPWVRIGTLMGNFREILLYIGIFKRAQTSMIQIHAPMRNPIRGIAQKNGVGISLTGMLRARKDLVSKQIKHILHLPSFIFLLLFF